MMSKDPTANHLNESNNLTDITAEFSEEEEDDIPLRKYLTPPLLPSLDPLHPTT